MNISLSNVSKKYNRKIVLDGVSVSFESGNIHALLGDNGAGKSTMASILSGAIQADSGYIEINGEEIKFSSQRKAVEMGIICVKQRPLLAENITIRENILLGTEFCKADKKESRNTILKKAELLKQTFAPNINFNNQVINIGGDERFYVSLISALVKSPQVLILDEPSALLDSKQRQTLYENFKSLSAGGMTIIVITHILQEAMQYADTITVLRDGKIEKSAKNDKNFCSDITGVCNIINYKQFAQYKIDYEESYTKTKQNKNDFIAFNNITVRPRKRPALFDVSFKAQSGNITLIHGLQESGLGTLENVITGMEKEKVLGSCFISVNNITKSADLKSKSFNTKFIRNKSNLIPAIIPSNKTFRASNPALTIEQLLCARYNKNDSKRYSKYLIEKAEVDITESELASSLSGGMLQRLILAREFSVEPNIIFASEPLQGLDYKASSHITSLLSSFAKKGCIVIVLSSSEFPTNICNTIYNLEGGYITKATDNSIGNTREKKINNL